MEDSDSGGGGPGEAPGASQSSPSSRPHWPWASAVEAAGEAEAPSRVASKTSRASRASGFSWAASEASRTSMSSRGSRRSAANAMSAAVSGAWASSVIQDLMEPMFQEPPDAEAQKMWLPPESATSSRTLPSSRRALLLVSEKMPERGRWSRVLVESKFFILLSCVVIVVNSVVLGVEQSQLLHTGSSSVSGTRFFFYSFYALELALRMLGHGFLAFKRDSWIKLDAIVLTLELLGEFVQVSFIGAGESVLLLRLLRLTALARIVRPAARFRILKLLIRAFVSSAGLMGNTVLLLTLFLYLFAVLGTEVVGMHRFAEGPEARSEFGDIAGRYFRSVPTAMLTLVQFVCLDTVAAIYRPLVRLDGRLALYFVAVTLLVPVLLMNLVTGVIVSCMKEQIQQNDAETLKMQKVQLARILRALFRRLDEDGSGQLTREEIINISEEDRQFLSASTNMSSPLTIFDALDLEETGTLNMEEFCDGIWCLATSKSTLRVRQMENQVTCSLGRMRSLGSRQAGTLTSMRRALELQKGLQAALRSQAS